MSDDILKAIAALGADLRGEISQLGTDLRDEIVKSRGETAKLIEGVQTSIDDIREDLTKRQARRPT
jgi:hypothetical protein